MRPRSIRPLLTLLAIAITALAITGTGTARAALNWSGLKLIDRSQPFAFPATINGVSCPTSSFCFALGDQGTVVTATTSGTPTVIRKGVNSFGTLTGVSCPSASLCFAIQGTSVLFTRNPTAPKPIFSTVKLKVGAGVFTSISCPTALLCVAAASTGAVWTSTRPTGPASAWRSTQLAASPRFLNALACVPGAQLCVASTSGLGGANPLLATTTNPTGGPTAWTLATAPNTNAVTAISCPSTAMCVGISSDEVLSSADPAAGGLSWTVAPGVDPTQVAPLGVACGSATPASCLVTIAGGAVLVGSGTAAAPIWTRSDTLVTAGFGDAIGCLPGVQANCLAPVLRGGIARVLAPPAPGTPSASVAGTSGLTPINDLACPSGSLCVGVDGAGGVVRTSRPLGPGSGWHRAIQPAVSPSSPEEQSGPYGLDSVSCPTLHFCAAAGAQDKLLISRSPGSATPWQVFTLPFLLEESAGTFRENLGPIWCTSSTLCVSAGDSNRLFVSTNPAGGASTWRAFSIGYFNEDTWSAIGCRDRTLCIAGDAVNGRIAVSTAPARSWHLFRLLGGGIRAASITAVACVRDRGVCLVGTGTGALWRSTHPARGPGSFRRIRLSQRRIDGIACRSQRLCIAIDELGRVFWSTNPAGGAGTWHHKTLDSTNWPSGGRLTAVACAPGGVCLAGDAGGRVYSAP